MNFQQHADVIRGALRSLLRAVELAEAQGYRVVLHLEDQYGIMHEKGPKRFVKCALQQQEIVYDIEHHTTGSSDYPE